MTQDQHANTIPASLRDLDQVTHLDSVVLKQHYVTTMFEIIAPRYNRFTRAFSFGMDAVWKNQLVELAKPYVTETSCVLDLACGTGDLAFAFARLAPRGHILGIDAAPTMISLAKSTAITNAVHHVDFAVGDLTLLELPDASHDVVSMGMVYAMFRWCAPRCAKSIACCGRAAFLLISTLPALMNSGGVSCISATC